MSRSFFYNLRQMSSRSLSSLQGSVASPDLHAILSYLERTGLTGTFLKWTWQEMPGKFVTVDELVSQNGIIYGII